MRILESNETKHSPLMSTVVVLNNPNNGTYPEWFTVYCEGSKCNLWETNEPEETKGKLFDNGYCGLKNDPFRR